MCLQVPELEEGEIREESKQQMPINTVAHIETPSVCVCVCIYVCIYICVCVCVCNCVYVCFLAQF